ncbi:hypothetical protein EG68_03347 [Paragonimus skrjabini miyazakii]|uniref:Uncharacterized protein n=1 Tax=Paragonimus skrjabini miyazakii TaxID=59628 RepID=A0A8S9Z0X4_9TREM|nr:hypothetical protein EG68_03347 [Paragonimus skrjabini miyazakii]
MLDVEVVPELAVRHKTWEFVLGMPIQQMIDILRKNDQIIRAVDFWYNDKSPFSSNMVIVLPNDGLRFHFDPYLQRLRLIEVVDMSKICLRYWSQYFNSPSVLPTIQEILRIFGSTKPLLPVDARGGYRLYYRGITFILKALHTASGDSQPSSLSTVTGSPNSMSDGNTQNSLIVSRLFIYLGNNLNEARLSPELPGSCYLDNVFLEHLEVNRSENLTKKLCFHLVTQDLQTSMTREPQITRFARSLSFGDSVQDVLSALGSPSRIFYKTEDKMKIHLPQSYRLEQPRRSDYFFNYFTLGVDILFDARYHHVTKFVLHTNQPGEYTFNTYYRCLFEIPLPASHEADTKTQGKLQHQSPELADNKSLKPEVSTPVPKSDVLVVNPFVKWSVVQRNIDSLVNVEPVVIHRDTKPQKNPFGPTHAYGYQDIIFEVIPTNGYIASVTLYAPAHSLPN